MSYRKPPLADAADLARALMVAALIAGISAMFFLTWVSIVRVP